MAFRLAPAGFENLSEDQVMAFSFLVEYSTAVYKRFARVTDRRVRYPTGGVFDFDVVGKGSDFTSVVAFCTKTKLISIICEYAQGPNRMTFSLPGGSFDPRKHSSLEDCCLQELSEEAGLRQPDGSKVLPLAPGLCFGKSTVDKVYPFLVLDAEPDPQFSHELQDAEEFIFVKEVPLERIFELMEQGSFLGVASCTFMLALRRLTAMGLLPSATP